jgi:hypothetical protein
MQKWMKSFVALAICSLATATAAAQELPGPLDLEATCAPEVVSPYRGGRTTVEVDEHAVDRALWFHPDVGACVTQRLGLLPMFAQHVQLLEQRLKLTDERLKLEMRRAALAIEAEEVASGALEAAIRARRQAEEKRDAWYRTPGFLVSMGALGIVVVEVLIVVILHRVGTFD